MTMTQTRTRLEFDLADYMGKAVRESGLSVSAIAEELEVHRNTVGRWLAGTSEPRKRELRRFADLTGVPLEWLEESRLRESNSRPSHYE